MAKDDFTPKTKDERIIKNSIVQVTADGGNTDKCWIGCLAQVDEVKSWGAQGWINIPEERQEPAKRAYIRLTWDEMEYIGDAVMIPQES